MIVVEDTATVSAPVGESSVGETANESVPPAVSPEPGDEPETAAASVTPPLGVFSSAGSLDPKVVDHAQVRGVLVRVFWKEIEPTAGNYDFSLIDRQLSLLGPAGKDWSLGVVAGPHSPEWLYAPPYSIAPLNIVFRGAKTKVPKFWESVLQDRLGALALALADRYGADSHLRLVYLPQMSANGIEGHFNGNTDADLTSQGLTADLWVEAVLQGARSFLSAFPSKPVAVELHHILSSASAGKKIMNTILSDPELLDRLGTAIWWFGDKNLNTAYGELIGAFTDFIAGGGAVYAQMVDQSVNASSFENGDFTRPFQQAKDMGIRYIEVWNQDFTGAWDGTLADFNQFAEQ